LVATGVDPPVERAIEEAVQKIPALLLVPGGKKAAAQRWLNVEVVRIGSSRVVYLQANDVGSSVSLAGDAGEVVAADRPRLRAALARVLDPDHFRGRLALKVDVPGAEVQIDGKKQPEAQKAIELAVGTHAIRVTHPQYRDFLRFADVEYDQTLAIDVALSAYPLAEGEMSEKQRRLPAKRRVPWWRSWWALSLAGLALTGVTVGAVWGARPTLSYDKIVTYRPSPTP